MAWCVLPSLDIDLQDYLPIQDLDKLNKYLPNWCLLFTEPYQMLINHGK